VFIELYELNVYIQLMFGAAWGRFFSEYFGSFLANHSTSVPHSSAPTRTVARKTEERNLGTYLLFRISESTGKKTTVPYRAVVQAVSHLPLILEFRPCEIFGGHSGTG
jgi:hypothetical protein